MFEAFVESLKYIRDVPMELTEKAVLAGEVRKGSVVGLQVYPVSDHSKTVLVEVKLLEEGQEELVKPGIKVPLVDCGGLYRFASEWQQYLLRESPQAYDSGDSDKNDIQRPNSSLF
jgi:hypothetical protein